MAATLDHKAMTAHIRKRIKHEGIAARVRMVEACGSRIIQVFGVTYEALWNERELRLIARIARVNGLTFVRGIEITEDHCAEMTKRAHFEFYFGYSAKAA